MGWPSFQEVFVGKGTAIADLPRIVNLLQTNVEKVLSYLIGKTWLDTTIIPGIQLVSGSNAIPHGRKVLAGWSVSSQRVSAAAVFELKRDSQFLYLNSSGMSTIDLVVW